MPKSFTIKIQFQSSTEHLQEEEKPLSPCQNIKLRIYWVGVNVTAFITPKVLIVNVYSVILWWYDASLGQTANKYNL